LLVATPAVEGDAFRRSVVLMLTTTPTGPRGSCSTSPRRPLSMRCCPGGRPSRRLRRRLFRGGPVGTDSAIGIVSVPGEGGDLGVQRLFGGIGVVDLDAPPLLVAPEVAGLRIFAGYAGWSGGQLEGEIRPRRLVRRGRRAARRVHRRAAGLWESVLRRQRGNLAFVALYPDDPSMN
jgi:putative transcriptional regulator